MELTPVEKIYYIGQLLHVCQSNEVLFKIGKDLIQSGKMRGLLDGVKIIPQTENDKIF